jgi:hypothetical protein
MAKSASTAAEGLDKYLARREEARRVVQLIKAGKNWRTV